MIRCWVWMLVANTPHIYPTQSQKELSVHYPARDHNTKMEERGRERRNRERGKDRDRETERETVIGREEKGKRKKRDVQLTVDQR